MILLQWTQCMLELVESRSAASFSQALPAAVEATRELRKQQRWMGHARWKAIDYLTEHLLDEIEVQEASGRIKAPGARDVEAIVHVVCHLAWLPVGDGS
jgi:hypothetical protein